MYNTLEQLLLLGKILIAGICCAFLALVLICFVFMVILLLVSSVRTLKGMMKQNKGSSTKEAVIPVDKMSKILERKYEKGGVIKDDRTGAD